MHIMWFIKRRHPLIILGICFGLAVATAFGLEDTRQTLGGALIAAIGISLFELFDLPTR